MRNRIYSFYVFLKHIVNITIQTLSFSPWPLFHIIIFNDSQVELGCPVPPRGGKSHFKMNCHNCSLPVNGDQTGFTKRCLNLVKTNLSFLAFYRGSKLYFVLRWKSSNWMQWELLSSDILPTPTHLINSWKLLHGQEVRKTHKLRT